MTGGYRVVVAVAENLPDWGRMRSALWPWDDAQAHAQDARKYYLESDRVRDRIAYVALDDRGKAVGFAEATIRHDCVEGCDTSPVGFLEGIYVEPAYRRSGIATSLSDAVAQWARRRGCREYASNALLDNAASHAFHASIGFIETERVVFFKRDLD